MNICRVTLANTCNVPKINDGLSVGKSQKKRMKKSLKENGNDV